MTITHPAARALVVSSAFGTVDHHHELIERGDTDHQVVATATTWEANPTISEHQTRELEPDERIWLREYAAIPQLAQLAAFPAADVDRAFLPRVPPFTPAARVLLLDPSSGGLSTRDRFTWAIASWCIDEVGKWAVHGDGTFIAGPHHLGRFELPGWEPRGQPYMALHEVGAFEGGFAGSLTGDQIADELKRVTRRHDVRHAHSDQRESLFLTTALKRRDIMLHCHTWTAPSKAQGVQLVRRWLADRALSLPPDAEALRRELLGFEEVINASGALTFGARRGGHDDYAALLVTLAHAELNAETRLPRSNLGPRFKYGRLQHDPHFG
jgi:hypothetical protein